MGSGQVSYGLRGPARGAVLAGGGVLAVVTAVVTVVNPLAGAACLAGLVLVALGVRNPTVAARAGRVALCAAGIVAVGVFVALAPRAAAITVVCVAAARVAAPRVREAPDFARAVAKPLAVLGCVAVIVAAAAWPATAALVAIVALGLALAWYSPGWALAAGALLIGFEGSIKILLGLEHTPLPGGNRAVGAAAIDVVIFTAIVLLVRRDGFATPRRLWRAAGRVERWTIAVFLGWFAVSILQTAQNGSLRDGIAGFRLFQAYALVAVAALIVFVAERNRLRATQVLLGIGLAVSLFAALRVLTGPSLVEAEFATSIDTVVAYGGALRAVGSFSSSVGLVSFLVPFSVFALVIGYAERRVRALAWGAAGLALVGIVASYGRASLAGIALGLVCAVAVLLATADTSARRKLAAAGLALLVLAGMFGAVQLASHASPQLRKRAGGLLDPLGDKSAQERFDTWGRTLRKSVPKPFGHGIGTVGGSSEVKRRGLATTDNSFLKVVYEQGLLVGAAFLAAIVAAVILLVRRLHTAAPAERALGVSALAGFVAFMGISLTGEYVDQPGKVVAWGLLGVAAAMALPPAQPRRSDPEGAAP